MTMEEDLGLSQVIVQPSGDLGQVKYPSEL